LAAIGIICPADNGVPRITLNRWLRLMAFHALLAAIGAAALRACPGGTEHHLEAFL
jgi:hypothetical protein